jgi:hypothetical protein
MVSSLSKGRISKKEYQLLQLRTELGTSKIQSRHYTAIFDNFNFTHGFGVVVT